MWAISPTPSPFKAIYLPAGLLAAATIAVWIGRPLPASLSGLRTYGPYAVLGAALVLAWWFNRGRSFVLAASLLGAVAAYDYLHLKAVYTALVVLVPLNVLFVMIRPERGARYRAAYGWLLLLLLEAGLLILISRAPQIHAALDNWALRSPPIPLVGRLMFAAAFAAAIWRAWPEYKPLQVGNVGALAAFFIGAAWAAAPGPYAAFVAAAGVILIAALLHESHQLAFHDQLTGLPGRRALEERLRSLEGSYAIAMVDVDHFKKFNDTHGHAIGDQVLKLVGGRLGQIAGGGIAYRYGGEEFCVLFPGVSLDEAERELESTRDAIEKYRMAVRGEDRPKKAEVGAKLRGAAAPEKLLSVTVSIGVAAPSETETLATPHQVIRAADEALYRAKHGGRNRVSR